MQKTNAQANELLQVVDEITSLIIIADARQRITWINKCVSDKTGYKLNDIKGKQLATLLIGKNTNKQKQTLLAEALKSGETFKGTLLHYTKKGVPFWNEVSIKPIRNTEQKIEKYIFVSNDVTDRLEKNEELLYNELRWKFAIEKSGDDYFEYNFENNRFFGSENLQSLLRINKESSEFDIVSAINILHPDDTEKAVNALFDLISGKYNTVQEEIRLLNKNKNFVWVSIRATITNRDTKGNPVNLIGTTSDISKIKETEAELIKAKLKAEEISEYKNRFLATMSHEIRTPLNGIIGLSNLMLLENKNQDLNENLNTLSFSANHLLSLINDILDLSKIESGKIDFAAEHFNLHETVQDVYKTFLSACKSKNIQLKVVVHKNIPAWVSGDKIRLIQILNNLVNNAVKFTDKGKVELAVSLQKKSGNKAVLQFVVADTGIGISAENQQKIFEDFVQADSSITSKYGGTGLGLSITKKLIEMQQGKLHLQSILNKGSRFSFTLPLLIADKQSISVAKSTSAKETENLLLQDVRILLAEDNPVNQKVALSYFKHWQAKSDCANNGKEAVAFFKQKQYDILIVDLYMPELDGFEAITQIRKLKVGKNIPIIALTASAEDATMAKAVKCGADICLTKPFDANQLLSEIQRLCKKQTVAIKLKAASRKIANHKHINLRKLEDASLGSTTFVAEMVDTIKQEVPPLLDECTMFLKKKDLTNLASSVHKLKNSLLLIGLDSLANELKLLENKSREGKFEKAFTPALNKIFEVWAAAEKELNNI